MLNKNNQNREGKMLRFYKWVTVALSIALLLLCIFLLIAKEDGPEFLADKNVYLNPALKVLDKRNLIVDFQKLREKLQEYEKRTDYTISIYFEYFPTGANIATHKDERIWPASLIKIPVAMAAMKKIQDGTWKLDNELVILDQDKDSEYGELYKMPTGTTLTIRRLLEESLINSDNTAHFILLRNIEGRELEDVFVHLGMDDVIDSLKRNKKDADIDNRITAKRYSIFFRSLYNATFLDQKYSEMFLDILSRAPKEYVSLGLPEDVNFVHKTGIRIDEKVMADSGIVYAGGRPYLITIMIAQKEAGELKKDETKKLFEEIGEVIYSYVVYAD